MWIVRLALRRPYTFVVMAILIAILGGVSIATMPIDIFPYINIPTISVVWQYSGLSPEEMEKRLVSTFERVLTTTVNDIERMESTSYSGVSVTRIYFQPNVKIDMAMSQVTSISQTLTRGFPPGTYPPAILKYDASSVPIIQLGFGSDTLSEQQIFDLTQNFVRQQLVTIPGISVQPPFGGKQRQVMVDLNLNELYAKQLTPADVSNALGLQNLILPAGTAKIADTEYQVKLNSSPVTIAEMNNLPVRVVNGATVYMKDVANIRDGNSVQNNLVRTNGTHGVLLTINRNGQASTLDVINGVKKALPRILAGLPPALKMREMFDQSVFVKGAVQGVLREGLVAACLTGIMILLFLGSWRSTLIVCISIPLSIFVSISLLSAMGHTINVMTLGGLALAVGILVDDATVEIENVHRNMGMHGKSLARAILDGAQQIAVPAFVSTLAICIVFVPVLLLTGTAKFLFTPLALAVAFAMMASYLLSRTLVPTLVHFLLKGEAKLYQAGKDGEAEGGSGIIWRAHHIFNHGFEALRSRYTGFLDWALDHRATVLTVFIVFVGASMSLIHFVGRDFFPTIDAGIMRLHARAPVGSRLEETEIRYRSVEDEIHKMIPENELDTIVDNIGLGNGGLSLAFSDSATINSGDGEILISLKKGHAPTELYIQRLRKTLNERFPDMVFFFQPADITAQILNAGLAAPIDLQVVGRSPKNFEIAQDLVARVAKVPGATDVHLHQINSYPVIQLDVDRSKAAAMGMTERDITNNMLISLSSTSQISPTFWVNWANGVNYNVSVQTPQYQLNSVDALLRTPIGLMSPALSSNGSSLAGTSGAVVSSIGTAPSGSSQAYGNPGAIPTVTQRLSNVVTVRRSFAPGIVSHYNITPVFDVYANIDRRDLGSVGGEIEKIADSVRKKLPAGTDLIMRGQYQTMDSSFIRLGLGMIAAVVLVYLLMAVNFQSWLDPFIILTALPGAMAGIVWILFVTQTTFSVPSLMGSIMCVGVATANSILLVTFANDQRIEGMNAREAALAAGYTRIRPVLMTAAAMILGMLPLSLGLGEGGEQNAPLGRAVIGGLLFATLTTLVIVPIIYSYLRTKPPVNHEQELEEEEREGLPDPGVELSFHS